MHRHLPKLEFNDLTEMDIFWIYYGYKMDIYPSREVNRNFYQKTKCKKKSLLHIPTPLGGTNTIASGTNVILLRFVFRNLSLQKKFSGLHFAHGPFRNHKFRIHGHDYIPPDPARKRIMERKNQSSNSESEDTEDYMYWQQQEAQRTSAAVIHKRDVHLLILLHIVQTM